MEDAEKVEMPNAFFAFVFTGKKLSAISDSGNQGKGMLEGRFFFKEDWVREHPGKLSIHKSISPDGLHQRVLRAGGHHNEAAHDRSGQSEVPEDWKKANVILVFRNGK